MPLEVITLKNSSNNSLVFERSIQLGSFNSNKLEVYQNDPRSFVKHEVKQNIFEKYKKKKKWCKRTDKNWNMRQQMITKKNKTGIKIPGKRKC